jgi:MFS family permease
MIRCWPETILGVGMSLVSGADSAMLYDSLLAGSKADKYTRYEGRITSIGNFAEAFAGIMGGLLATLSLRTPYFFQAGVAFIAIPAALMLIEPPVHGHIRKPHLRDVVKVVGDVFGRNKKLAWNTVFSAVTGVSTLTMAWFAQPWMKTAGLPVSIFGVVWAILNLSVGLTAINAWRIEGRMGVPLTVMLFTGALFASWILLALTGRLEGLLLLLLFYLARGLATPTLRNYINIIAPSETRATVLSVRNFIIRGLFALLGPLFGRLTDQFGLSTAMLISGLILGTLAGGSLVFFLRFKTYRKE